MQNYIADSCVWIDFFKNDRHYETIINLIKNDNLYMNGIVLAETIPSSKKRNEIKTIQTLSLIKKVPLSIDWDEISEIKYLSIKNGINDIGLLDIAIAQNAKQNNMGIFSTDKHFKLLQKVYDFELKEQ